MRTSIASRLLPLAGALVLAAAPAIALPPAHRDAPNDSTTRTSPSWSGVYRIMLAGKSNAPAALIVERAGTGLSAFMLVDERGTPLTKLRVDGDTFHARVATASGDGTLTLRIAGDEITGTLVVGKQTWDVTGQKTA